MEEIERTSSEDWHKERRWNILLLRRTRNRFAFVLALIGGFVFLFFEIFLMLNGRSTFNPLQAFGMLVILGESYIFAVLKKA